MERVPQAVLALWGPSPGFLGCPAQGEEPRSSNFSSTSETQAPRRDSGSTQRAQLLTAASAFTLLPSLVFGCPRGRAGGGTG